MKKILISITERQHEVLKKDAKVIGIPLAEFVRRIFDGYLEDRDAEMRQTQSVEEPST